MDRHRARYTARSGQSDPLSGVLKRTAWPNRQDRNGARTSRPSDPPALNTSADAPSGVMATA